MSCDSHVSVEDARANISSILAKLGLPSCQFDGTGSIIAPVTQPVDSNVLTIPCEKIEELAERYVRAQRAIACAISVAQDPTETVAISQNVSVQNLPFGRIDCRCARGTTCKGGLTISSTASANLFRQNVDTEQVHAAVEGLATFLLRELAPNDPELPEAEEEAKDILDQVNWEQVITNEVSRIYANQSIRIVNSGTITGNGCNVSNYLVINLISDLTITSTLLESYSSSVVTSLLDRVRAEVKHPKYMVQAWSIWLLIGIGVFALALLGWAIRRQMAK